MRIATVAVMAALMGVGASRRSPGEREVVVLRGAPTTRVVSDAVQSKRVTLSESARDSNLITIVKRGDRYYWESRDGRELSGSLSGVYWNFVDPRGGGYVKVLDERRLPADMRPLDPKVQYMEQAVGGLSTFTYWGSAVDFRP